MTNLKKNIFNFIFVFLFISVFLSPTVYANAQEQEKIMVFVFVGDGCPHCSQLENFLDTIKDEYNLDLNILETYYNKENQKLFEEMAKEHNISIKGVPVMFIGDTFFEGYSVSMNEDIINVITHNNQLKPKEETLKIPFLGVVNLSNISLPLITLILGFLDGFNPCAFFVLLFLLSMLVCAKSRKKMLIIGLTFVFFSGLIYFLFMSAWLNFFMVTKNITLVTTIAGIVALVIAILNIKDFFAFKKGASLSVSDKQKKSLITKMRDLLKAESFISLFIGTIALAIAANMYELLCTAGFPMVFTKILVLQELSKVSYYLYLVLYNVVYVIPLLTIVLIFTITFGAKKLTQEQGEALKLLSGMMMLALGSLLVFAPGLLNNVFAAIGLILLALFLSGLILFIKKKVKKNETQSTK